MKMANWGKVISGVVKVVGGTFGVVAGVDEASELLKEGTQDVAEGATEN